MACFLKHVTLSNALNHAYSSGTSISPLSIAAMISEGCWPFTVQPTELEMTSSKHHSLAGSEHLLHGSSELVRVGTLTQNLRHLNDLIESDVSIVLNYG